MVSAIQALLIKLSGGNFSTVMGDSGHPNVESIEGYAEHIFDENRIRLNKILQHDFYGRPDDFNKLSNESNEESLRRLISERVKSDASLRQDVLTALFSMVAK